MLDFNKETQLDFLDWIRDGGIEIHHLEQWQLGEFGKKWKISDLPANFTDASLLEVAESRNVENIITLDCDFNVYRLPDNRTLINLLS